MPDFDEKSKLWIGMFAILATGIATSALLNKLVFNEVGENLTFNVRKLLFSKIMDKEISWFDNKNRAPGILSNVLSEDINCLNGLTTEHIATLLEAILSLVVGIIISLFLNWKMALITLGITPLVSMGSIITSRLQWKVKPGSKTEEDDKKDDPYKQSNALLSDILMNYRTVVSFGEKNVDYLLNMFDRLLLVPNQKGVRYAHISALFFGYSQFMRFAFVAVTFYISAYFIYKQNDPPKDTYLAVYVLFVAAIGAGIAVNSVPPLGKARNSAENIFEIIDC